MPDLSSLYPRYDEEIENADYTGLCKLMKRFYRTAVARARERFEQLFWVGAAICRAEAFAKDPAKFYKRLHLDTGIAPGVLKQSLALYDIMGGDFDRLLQVCNEIQQKHGDLVLSDVGRLINANRNAARVGRVKRTVETVLNKETPKLGAEVVVPGREEERPRKKRSEPFFESHIGRSVAIRKLLDRVEERVHVASVGKYRVYLVLEQEETS